MRGSKLRVLSANEERVRKREQVRKCRGQHELRTNNQVSRSRGTNACRCLRLMEALVKTASIKLLRELITAGGLSDAGIVEKSELRELAVRACGTAPSAALASLMQDAGTEALRKVLDDPASTAGQRDFARMRLAEEQPLPAPAQQGDIACSGDRVFTGESLSRNQRLEKAVQDWKAADAFEDQDMRDAREAVQ